MGERKPGFIVVGLAWVFGRGRKGTYGEATMGMGSQDVAKAVEVARTNTSGRSVAWV